LSEVVAIIGRHVRTAFGADIRVLLREPGGRLAPAGGAALTAAEPDGELAQLAFQTWEAVGVGTTQFPKARNLYLPLVGSHGRLGVLELHPDDPGRFAQPAVRWLLQTFAARAALALERVLPAVSAAPRVE
jgi:two-component system sensor histidine kinase KdpD